MQYRVSMPRFMVPSPGFIRRIREAVTGSYIKEVSLEHPRELAERRTSRRATSDLEVCWGLIEVYPQDTAKLESLIGWNVSGWLEVALRGKR
jgi:hypothetical protein